jgi:hypothetical protein
LPLFDLVEHVPRDAPSPAPAAKHFVPVAFDRPMDLLQGTKVSGNVVVGVMASQRGIESIELLPDGFVAAGSATTSECAASEISWCAFQS